MFKSQRAQAITAVIVAVVLAAAYIIWMPVNQTVNKQLSAFAYRLGDAESGESVDIIISGTVKRKLFRPVKSFEGSLEVSSLKETQGNWLVFLYVSGEGVLMYHQGPEPIYMGTIALQGKLDSVLLLIDERRISGEGYGWSGENGYVIAAPATSREEAVAAAARIAATSEIYGTITDWS